MNEKRYMTLFDEGTKKWIADHSEWLVSRVAQCKECKLFYKPDLGHECRKVKEKDKYDEK